MNQFAKAGTISPTDFILATRKYLAEKVRLRGAARKRDIDVCSKKANTVLSSQAKIRCFFQFDVTVDLEQSRVFPSPDVEEWIETLHRTNMSVIYVLANFKPIKKHYMVEPYVRMSEQEDEEPEELVVPSPYSPRSGRRSSFMDDAVSSARDTTHQYLWTPDHPKTDFKVRADKAIPPCAPSLPPTFSALSNVVKTPPPLLLASLVAAS